MLSGRCGSDTSELRTGLMAKAIAARPIGPRKTTFHPRNRTSPGLVDAMFVSWSGMSVFMTWLSVTAAPEPVMKNESKETPSRQTGSTGNRFRSDHMNIFFGKRLRCAMGIVMCAALPVLRSAAQTESKDTSYQELSPDRIKEIAGFLSEQPTGLGRPIEDRAFWTDPAFVERAKAESVGAAELLAKPFPRWSDEGYLEYSKNLKKGLGESENHAERDRIKWLKPLVLAECLENKGRYLPLLNQTLESFAAEPSWVWSSEDVDLKMFHRQAYDIALGSATFGLELAETLYLLGGKLDPQVRRDLQAAIEQKILEPFRHRLRTGKGCTWITRTNNWNAVCLSGVVGAALITVADKNDRAVFVAAGEHYSQYYLRSFSDDGYCLEGVKYWQFGFGHYAMLREQIFAATGGRIDLLANPLCKAVALYGVRILIGSQSVPPFGDCYFGITTDPALVAYSNQVMQLGLQCEPYLKLPATVPHNELTETVMLPTPLADHSATNSAPEDPLRSFYAKEGILLCRPAPGAPCRLGIGIKAGGDERGPHSSGGHSHNDVGSYSIAIGDDEPTGDPGYPTKGDSKIFGPERYNRSMFNSYGHPVPVIAGKLQILAADAEPVVLSTSFTPTHDQIKMDISTAYPVPELKRMVRTMDYDRAGAGVIRITDEATFTAATTFEDALITRGEWKQVDPQTGVLSLGNAKLAVTIKSSPGATFRAKVIEETNCPRFVRIGLEFKQPVIAAQIQMEFRPTQ